MEEKKRKSNRSFELEKGGKRSFDLNKTSARMFDLAKESDEVSLEELKKDLLADGKIDAEEVNKLREVLYVDGKIDQVEADFLFELNDAVSGKPNDSSWNQFFVEAISDYLLNDEKSPGVIDNEESKWLVEKIGADGQVDGVEKELIVNLKKRAKSMPSSVLSLIASDNKRPEHPIPEGDASDGKSSKWKWLIPAAIVAAAVPSYFLFTGNDDMSSTKDPIVATAPETGQNNPGGDAANPNSLTSESNNSDNVANSNDDGDVNNIGGAGNPSGSENSGTVDNSSETGNVRNAPSSESGNVGSSSSATGNVGISSSGEKVSTPQSSDVQSSPQNKATSASSTASTGNSSVKEGKTDNSLRRGTPDFGNSKNSGTLGNPIISGSIEQKALDVIRGIYGNGQVRKDKLGAEYAEIQKLVNEMYRNGTVKR